MQTCALLAYLTAPSYLFAAAGGEVGLSGRGSEKTHQAV